MNYHIARDGTQLGTFTLDQVRDGLANGSIQSTDLAWAEGMDDWKPVGALNILPAGAPPAVPEVPAIPAVPPVPAAIPSRPASLPNQPPAQVISGTETCGQATTSMILGLLSCALSCLTAIPAVIFGHIALNKIGKSGGRLSGRGMAITGLVLGYLQIAALPVMMGIALPAFVKVQEKAQTLQAANEGRQIIIALKTYAGDHNGKYPATLEVLITENLLFDNDVMNSKPPQGWVGPSGWDYFGADLSDSSPGDAVLISSKFQSATNQRIVGYNDGSVNTEK